VLLNYYQILEVPYNSSLEEIKTAFRIKAKLLHPDVNKASNAKVLFQLLNEAYQVLADTEKRRLYDNKWRRLYGESFHKRTNTTQNQTQHHSHKYYKANARSYYTKQKDDVPYKKTIIDKYLFYSLVVIALFSILMGIYHLLFKEWEGLTNITGLIFGLWTLFLLFYGWRTLSKE